MKKLMILSLGYILSTLSLMADWETVNGYKWIYRINRDNTAEISTSSFSEAAISPSPVGAVSVPSTLGGKPVTVIGQNAFYECKNLTSITLNNNVTNIGYQAFRNCSGLTNVMMRSGLKSIGTYAFLDCTSLPKIIIPNSVTSIGNSAFSGCSGLIDISIPNSVTDIAAFAFNGCSSLTNLVIPAGVTSIAADTFYNCSSLKRVTIPGNVRTIWDSAFFGCANLSTLYFLGDAPSLGGNTIFKGCTNNPTVFVTRTSTGWGVPIPGTWNGLSIRYDTQIVSFDANGGVCATETSVVEHGAPVGALPTASRPGYVFLGWFTAAGNKVTPATVITDDMTFHAMWEARAWTLESCLDATNLIFSDDCAAA